MAITKTQIIGTKIICEIDSSNLVMSEYDSETQKLLTTFKKWGQYMSMMKFLTKSSLNFRLAESQGKFFNQNISKHFP